MRSLVGFVVFCVLAVASCGDSAHPPTARVTPTPAYLPLNDAYHTDLRLDGSASRNDLDDPRGVAPLTFRWLIDDPAPQIVDGAVDAAVLTVRLAAASPTTVTLTVTDAAGTTGRVALRVGVTVPRN